MTSRIHAATLDTCEGARYSAYITPDMRMLPCSFDQQHKWAMNLNESSIEEAWNSKVFDSFRDQLKNSCPSCALRASCMGGCPINKEIVLCGTVNGGGVIEDQN